MINNRTMKRQPAQSARKMYVSPSLHVMEIDSEQITINNNSPSFNQGQAAKSDSQVLEKHNDRNWGDLWSEE